jgi:hypothetical protein
MPSFRYEISLRRKPGAVIYGADAAGPLPQPALLHHAFGAHMRPADPS